jgi:hypothetical protein
MRFLKGLGLAEDAGRAALGALGFLKNLSRVGQTASFFFSM